MYEIEVYEDAKGRSPIREWIRALDSAAVSDKNSGIQLRQLLYQMERLRVSGPRVGTTIAKQIDGEIWEIRPGRNRVLFAVWRENKIVLLHMFRKTTAKTPRAEIDQAKRELRDWMTRREMK